MNEETKLQSAPPAESRTTPQTTPEKKTKSKKSPVILLIAIICVVALGVVAYFGFFAKNPWFITKTKTTSATTSKSIEDPTFNSNDLDKASSEPAQLEMVIDDYEEEDVEVWEGPGTDYDPNIHYDAVPEAKPAEKRPAKVASTSPSAREGVEDLNRQPLKTEVVEEPRPVVKDEGMINVAMVEQKPVFPGGDRAMYEWLCKNIKYPPEAQEEGATGKVTIQFVIEKDGSISNVKVARGKHPSLDREALRVVKSMPKWVPGRNNGQPVRVVYMIPVNFQLQNY